MSGPTAAICVIGDEILSGAVTDANGPYLLRALAARGVTVVELRQVGDQEAAIAEAVVALAARADRVVTCGGVGPTHDDVTMAGIARAVGRPLAVAQTLLAFFDADAPAYRKMATIPDGARVHTAGPGAAPFVPIVEVANIFVLPGVPHLLRACFEGADLWGHGPAFHTREVMLACPESAVADILAQVQGACAGVQIGSYPQVTPPGAPKRLKITCRGQDQTRVDDAHAMLVARLSARAQPQVAP